eukprot:CAMPEP_0176317670 /NCGR_PEP_ID=MMETSP0121_2-20121125/69373_1 /TAXON_ID=160619 /ORGANISM="Kryptoperidinium foliaceum, Strain CCMP 1326" /LENGTH=53 /DNA_ID=CAMNT_0017659929 /DNA_START=124 /DNA_END=282 /DNA_ORIENTATION=-
MERGASCPPQVGGGLCGDTSVDRFHRLCPSGSKFQRAEGASCTEPRRLVFIAR